MRFTLPFFHPFIFSIFLISTTLTAQTKVVLLGTGTPNPDSQHSGCSVAIVVGDKPYIVDFGPGLVRKAAAMSPRWGGTIEALTVKNLKTAFLTHLHSDHTVGLPDLLLTPWVLERDEPLQLFGPEGTKNMAEHILAAYQADINYRIYGLEPANNQGWRIETKEFSNDGEIFRDDRIKVEAFRVTHGSWPNAFGFRFTTPDKVIVFSGDTTPSKNLEKWAQGADILLHEVYHKKSWDEKPPFWKKYHKRNHTSTFELGEIAARVKPGVLVLYHILFWQGSAQDMLDEIGQKYDGKVIVGQDLMVIE